MKKEDGTKILFINVLRYIETGENANITINGKKYNVSVNKNDGKYYIEEESFENRQDFIDELYNKTSVMLTDNSVVILNYIADGTLKIDSSWQFYDKNYEQEKNKISKLYKRAIINLIILYFFIIVVNSLILLELSSLTENNLYTKIFTFDINKKIIAIFFIINSISIICCKSNIKKLKMLFKYSKKDLTELEDKVKKIKEKNIVFGGNYDIFFSDKQLILIDDHELEFINYDDIICLLDRNIKFKLSTRNSYEEGFCIITKKNNLIRMGNVVHKKILKEKLLEKNSNIIIKESNKNNITEKLVNIINKTILKDILNNGFCYISIIVEILIVLTYIFNQSILKVENRIISFIVNFYIFSIIYVSLECYIIYKKSKIN